jgi:nicotinate-nucleotide adenylyltransferase
MNIGLYFGSFNPIHIGHLVIANYLLNETQLDKIWFVVSPQNPFKQPQGLLNENDRLQLVRLAVQDDPRLKASDAEFKLSKPSYTANTLVHLAEKYPDYSFTIIAGSDSFQNMDKWKNADFILNNYPICVYKRKGFDITGPVRKNITLLDSPLIEISATDIRNLIARGKSIRYLVPEAVREEIETRRFYKPRDQKK